jgi:hypothetical protein
MDLRRRSDIGTSVLPVVWPSRRRSTARRPIVSWGSTTVDRPGRSHAAIGSSSKETTEDVGEGGADSRRPGVGGE